MGRAERVPPTGMSGMRHFDRRIVRWDARSAFPLRALAKAPYADGVVPTFFLCLRSCKHGAGCGDPVGRALRVPPTGMSTTIYSGEIRWDARSAFPLRV